MKAGDATVISVQLGAELARLDRELTAYVQRLTSVGRPAAALAPLVIGDDEISKLLAAMARDHVEQRDAPSGLPDFDLDDLECVLEPLEHARRVFGLTPFECRVLALALAAEVDGRYARLFAYVDDHGAGGRPTVGLALALFAELTAGIDRAIACVGPHGVLATRALVELRGDGALPSRRLALASGMLEHLLGDEPAVFPIIRRGDATEPLPWPAEHGRTADRAAAWLTQQLQSAPIAVVRGPPGSGREQLARAIALRVTRTAILADRGASDTPALAVREALWHEGAIIAADLAPDRVSSFAAAADAPLVPLVFVVDEAAPSIATTRPVLECTCTPWSASDRKRLWQALVPEAGDSIELASRFRFGPGRVVAAAREAHALAEARAGARAAITADDLGAACRNIAHAAFGDLATALPCEFRRDDIVLSTATRRELDLAIAWATHATAVFSPDGTGARTRASAGLACLFYGPPGTGKTMAAQVLAREIGQDLYKIDLSQVVDKYIGETEKNLARIFDEAERSNAILFFDEADALFARRTELKDSHDRYANIETAFLLQRIEAHSGIAILASNLRANLDDAFLRRLHVVAEFVMPDAGERQRIWEQLLPPVEQRADDVDLAFLAERFAIAGGDIRNAVVTAALIAAGDGPRIAMRHLVFAVWRELRKSGRLIDPHHFGSWRDALPEPGALQEPARTHAPRR